MGYTAKRIIIDMHEELKKLIKEIIEEELNEFSGVGAVAGFMVPPMPLFLNGCR